MVVPAILTSTNIDPMKSLMKRAVSWEQRDNVVNVAVFSGFYGSEQYEAGPSVVAITNDDPQLAEKIARDMVDYMWELKDGFFMKLTPVEEALRTIRENEGLWGLVDECDDPLGGGSR